MYSPNNIMLFYNSQLVRIYDWSLQFRVYTHLSSCEIKAWKKFMPEWDINFTEF